MQHRGMRDIGHDTADASHDCSETNHRVKRRNGLRQPCRGDASANYDTYKRVSSITEIER